MLNTDLFNFRISQELISFLAYHELLYYYTLTYLEKSNWVKLSVIEIIYVAIVHFLLVRNF